MLNHLLVAAGCLTAIVHGACVADFPGKLLSDPLVLQHASVVAAFEEVGRNLSSLFVNTTRDALSFAIVSVCTSLSELSLTQSVGTRLYAWHGVYVQPWHAQDERDRCGRIPRRFRHERLRLQDHVRIQEFCHELGVRGVESAEPDWTSKARPRYTLTHGAPGIRFAREGLE